MRAPNPRLQRTPLRAPLSRKPLGGTLKRKTPGVPTRAYGRAGALVLLAAASVGTFVSCHTRIQYPDTIAASDADLLKKYNCSAVLDLAQDSNLFKILVFRERKSDFKVVVYRKDAAIYRRLGPEFNLLNYDQPYLDAGPPPRVRTRHQPERSGFYLHISATEVDCQLEEGQWVPIREGVKAADRRPSNPTPGGK